MAHPIPNPLSLSLAATTLRLTPGTHYPLRALQLVYHALAFTSHPDKHPRAQSAHWTARFQAVNGAWEVLRGVGEKGYTVPACVWLGNAGVSVGASGERRRPEPLSWWETVRIIMGTLACLVVVPATIVLTLRYPLANLALLFIMVWSFWRFGNYRTARVVVGEF